MKTIRLTAFLLSILFLFSFGTLFAQQKTIVTTGLSWWNAQYSWETENGEKIGDIGSGNMFGPYLSISRGKLNFGTSLFWGSFPVDKINEGEASANGSSADLSMGRADLNFTIGYRIIPYLNLFIGGKYINWKIDGSMTYTSVIGYDDYGYPIYGDQQVSIEMSEGGMTFGAGISGVVPFGTSNWYAFGSLAGLAGTLTNETKLSLGGFSQTDSYDVDAALAAINLGIGYRFSSGFGINLGYRADLFSEKEKNVSTGNSSGEDNPRIRVEGAILTASYTF